MREPKLKKKNIINRLFKRQFFTSIVTIFLLIFILIGSSYALLNAKTETGLTDVVVQSGNLLATISSDSEMIEMNYTTLGVSDEIGLTYEPYTFKVTNNGEGTITYYELRIVDKEYEISTLPHKSLNFVLAKNNSEYTSIQNLGDNKSYIYVGGNLQKGESDTFNLKLWVNEEFGKYANNKELKASIELTLYSEMPTRNYIIYDTQGGNYIPKTNIASKRVTNQLPTKAGYTFLGWSSSASGNVDYESNAIYDRTNGTTLYAVWKEKKLYDVIITNAVMDNIKSEYVSSETGIDFSQISSNTNGRGLYMMADTKEEEYPIMYYRGNVDNNNVMFGGYCWQIVRTTETGGVKLIYNGTPGDVFEKTILKEEDYTIVSNTGNFTYDVSSGYMRTEVDSTNGIELSFIVPDGNYIIDLMGYAAKGSGLTGTYEIVNGSTSILNETLSYGGTVITNKEIGKLTSSNTITVKLTGSGWNWFNVRLIQKGGLIGTGCDNAGNNIFIKSSTFNKSRNALAYHGYMYNKVYGLVQESPVENAYFGNDVIYESGVYQLQSAQIGYATSRHYTCNSTDSSVTCEKIRYYIAGGGYIELSNGKKIADAVEEMTSNSDKNKTNSQVKIELETWYSNNLLKYANNIEDTVWCNDRSISGYGAFSTSGSGNLYYQSYSRGPTKNINLKCTDDVDNFSLGNQLATVNYPIGLITADETRLAGAVRYIVNTNYYLYTKSYYWTMSPSYFNPFNYVAYMFLINKHGSLDNDNLSYTYGLRPSISLIHDISYIKGDGTAHNPYIINTY